MVSGEDGWFHRGEQVGRGESRRGQHGELIGRLFHFVVMGRQIAIS
jgi:hypothetical protein